jgi:hypothetical protein
VTAGVLLCARALGEQLELPCPSTAEILSATSATRSRAYEVASEIRDLLPTLDRPPGPPRVERGPQPASRFAELRGEALRFLKSHAGCVRLERERMRYRDTWRHFVITLRERYADLSLPDLADALCMPLGTLEDLLRESIVASEPEREHIEPHEEAERDAKLAQIETVLAAWRAWRGDFTAFYAHVRRDLRIGFGKTMIATILFAHGERTPSRRVGRSRDEHALRGAFKTFFPGAQWVADGKA